MSALWLGATCRGGKSGVMPPQSKETSAMAILGCGGNRRATPLWETGYTHTHTMPKPGSLLKQHWPPLPQ